MQFREGEAVEVSSDEDGFQGALYTAKILKLLPEEKLLVEYKTLLSDEVENRALQETVSYGNVRPCPPRTTRKSGFRVHEEVDALYNDGWWVGLVSKVLPAGRYRVYFRDTGEEMVFAKSKLRVHHDWLNGRWVAPSEVALVLNPTPAFNCTESMYEEHVTPCPSATQPQRRPKLKFVRKSTSDNSLTKSETAASETVRNTDQIPVSVTTHQLNQGLNNERGILPESPFLELDGDIPQKDLLDKEDIDQMIEITTLDSQRPKRKHPIVTTSACIPAETDYPSILSQNHVSAEGELGATSHKSIKIKLHNDAMDMRGRNSPSKVKLKTKEASKNPPSQTKLANEISGVHVVKVPYLKSKNGFCQSDGGDLVGYGSQRDVNKVAYHFLLLALYLQGDHKWSNEIWLSAARTALGIDNNEHSKVLMRITSGQRS